jgi:hypothetical protein
MNTSDTRTIIRGVVGVDTGKTGHSEIHERDRDQYDQRHDNGCLGEFITAA